MNYIVLDLEWNQSPTGKVISNRNGALPFEIIEIGAVKLDEELKNISSFDRLIKPKVYLKLHKAIEKMLPITMRDLQNAKHFKEVFNEFREWCGDDIIFCTWGDMDLFQLQRNMNYFGITNDYPLPFLYLDLQSIFSEKYMKGIKNAGLNEAVDILNVSKCYPFHRAIYDAHYTAEIAKRLGLKMLEDNFSIDTYKVPLRSSEEFRIKNNRQEQYVTKAFESKEKATKYRKLRSCECFICGKPMERKVRWFCDNGKNFYSVFKCERHGYITGKFKVKKNDDGEFFAVRTMTKTDNDGYMLILEKKEKEKERERANPNTEAER